MTTSANSGYVAGIDGLRAYAVLAVIIYHFRNTWLPGGFTGVDVFFAISGYVVSRSLHEVDRSSFRKFALGFYARRILRICPALLVCLLVTGLLQTLFVPPSWLSTTSYKTGLFAFFGLSNFALVWFNDGYFSPRVEFNAFTHTWSLAVEEQFYFLFPAIFFAWRSASSCNPRLRIMASAALPALLIGSLVLCAVQTTAAADQAYYLLPARFWELAAGAMLFRLHSVGKLVPRSASARTACLAFGLALIGVGFGFADASQFPFPWALPSVVGTLFAIAGAVGDASAVGHKVQCARLFDNPSIVYLGKISYSLYLWHWPVAVLLRWTIGIEGPIALGLGLAATFAASAASYHLIERPVRQSRYTAVRSDRFIVSRGLAVIATAAGCGALTFLAQPYLSQSVTRDRANWYHGASSLQVDGSTFTRLLGRASPLTAAPTGPRLFLLGDSHAGAFATLAQMLRERHGMQVEVLTEAGCPAAGLLQPAEGGCAQFIVNSLHTIHAKAAPGDMVLLASLRSERIGDQWRVIDELAVVREQASVQAASSRVAAFEQADALIANLMNAGLKVIISAPLPVFKAPAFRCSDWFNSANPICAKGMAVEKQFLVDLRAPVMHSLERLAAKHPSLAIWDPLPVLCPGSTCSALDAGLPVFFDADHLSGHGNRLLYPSFMALLATLPSMRPPVVSSATAASIGAAR